jgi:quinol-cytochrome oxidoreductase complex cytochrome b subunit
MANRVYEWVDERTGIKPALDYVMYRRIPKNVNWFFTLGSASLVVFIVQFVTGIFLGMFYVPSNAAVTVDGVSSNEALESLKYLTEKVPLGGFLRGLHHWGATAMIVVVFLHMLRVFFMGSYKYPRELTWMVGVVIFLLTLGFGLTGYFLPWDNKAYWATAVTVKIAESAPVLGPPLKEILQGGPTLGVATITRFYALHVLLLPILMVTMVGIHMFLVVKIGISGMPAGKGKDTTSDGYFDVADPKMKKTGKAFFPYTIFKDAVVAVAVVAVIVVLAIVKPPEYSNPITLNNSISTIIHTDGTTSQLTPQPEWYFLFLFQFLKYFPPEFNFGFFSISGEAVGGIIIPTILILLMFAVPFLDRGPKRNPLNRPITIISMLVVLIFIVVLTVIAFIDNANFSKSLKPATPKTSSLVLSAPPDSMGVEAFGGAGSIQANE